LFVPPKCAILRLTLTHGQKEAGGWGRGAKDPLDGELNRTEQQ